MNCDLAAKSVPINIDMPKIRIYQKKGCGARYRVIDLYLDGEILGYIPNGESIEFNIPIGEHLLRAKMGFYRSKVVKCTMFNRESKSLTISRNSVVHMLFPIIILLLGVLQFYSARIYKSEHNGLMAFCGLSLLSVYSFTLGRNSLIMKEGEL